MDTIKLPSLFLRAAGHIVGLEGDYVNHPADHGGETRFGISKASYPDLDIANLSVEDAKHIYYIDYWQQCR